VSRRRSLGGGSGARGVQDEPGPWSRQGGQPGELLGVVKAETALAQDSEASGQPTEKGTLAEEVKEAVGCLACDGGGSPE